MNGDEGGGETSWVWVLGKERAEPARALSNANNITVRVRSTARPIPAPILTRRSAWQCNAYIYGEVFAREGVLHSRVPSMHIEA